MNDGQGVILTRQPNVLEGDLVVTFSGAPAGAIALFKTDGANCYRELEGGASCLIPHHILNGAIQVSVTCYNGTVTPQRWHCEGLVATTLANGAVILAPDDNNLPLDVANVKIAYHKLREDFAELEGKFNKLSDTFTSMMEGYDLT